MNLAAIFAFLLTSGICAETEFHSPDGARLTVMVCPRVVAADTQPSPRRRRNHQPGRNAGPSRPPQRFVSSRASRYHYMLW